jgi:hypothetical protein
MFAIANMGIKNAELETAMNEEIEKVRTTLISDEEYKKLMNQILKTQNCFVLLQSQKHQN